MLKRILNLFAAGLSVCAFAGMQINSPDGHLKVTVSDEGGGIAYGVFYQGREILAPSPVGVELDGVSYGASDQLGRVKSSTIREKFAWRGNKSKIDLRGTKVVIEAKHASGRGWELEFRCFNNGVAWRAVVPGAGEHRVTGERTAWTLPQGTVAWCNPDTLNYEGVYRKHRVNEIPSKEFSRGIGFPITFELAGGFYAALTEAEVMGYSGMTAEATGTWTLKSAFCDDPEGWMMDGDVRTPWRVLLVGDSLDRLVQGSDVVPALCAAPDKALFPKGVRTGWLKPGRCLWQWWAFDNAGTLWEKQHYFVDSAAALNCQYYLVDEGWEHPDQKWSTEGKTAWQRMKELCDYARNKGVDIWIWSGWTHNPKRLWPGLETPEKRETFFKRCQEAGVKGTKIDFMDSESHKMLEFYQDCLRFGAQYKVMVNFHGANKPAGEARTWPNEMTREGIRGLEYNKWDVLPEAHYATLPFTRYLAGHGDFTPTTFQSKNVKGTTVSQQLACAVITSSPILCWADKPEVYLDSPVVDFIRTMPAVWDETRVLAGSRIGELAVLARRSGKSWCVGAVNGGDEQSYTLDLSFLGRGQRMADFVMDTPGEPLKFAVDRGVAVNARTTREIRLSRGGGFVVRIR